MPLGLLAEALPGAGVDAVEVRPFLDSWRAVAMGTLYLSLSHYLILSVPHRLAPRHSLPLLSSLDVRFGGRSPNMTAGLS
jgi:hypothetical protein